MLSDDLVVAIFEVVIRVVQALYKHFTDSVLVTADVLPRKSLSIKISIDDGALKAVIV